MCKARQKIVNVIFLNTLFITLHRRKMVMNIPPSNTINCRKRKKKTARKRKTIYKMEMTRIKKKGKEIATHLKHCNRIFNVSLRPFEITYF